MKKFDDDATLSDMIDVAGYTPATPYNPRVRVFVTLDGHEGEYFQADVVKLDFDGDTNTVDIFVEEAM